MTDKVGVVVEFATVCKGFGAKLGSREGVDEIAVAGVWGLGPGVWEGMRTDGSLAMMAGDGEGSFLLKTSAPRQGEVRNKKGRRRF